MLALHVLNMLDMWTGVYVGIHRMDADGLSYECSVMMWAFHIHT